MFDEMGARDVVAWNSLASGYSQNGRAEEVLAVYDQIDGKVWMLVLWLLLLLWRLARS